MNIDKLQNNFSFKSGLTRKVIEAEKQVKPNSVKRYFQKSEYTDLHDFYNIDFKNNKAYALACRKCAEIFINLKRKHDYRNGCSMQNLIFPHDIYVFNKEDLTESYRKAHPSIFFMTNWYDNSDRFKEKTYIKYQTILMSNEYKSLEEINSIMNMEKTQRWLSSSHFLHPFVHEWIHAIQGKLIYDITEHRGGGDYRHTMENFLCRKVSKEENEIVANVLGGYAAEQEQSFPQYSEIFAEAWTKFICESLNSDCCSFKKDPVEEMKKTPKEFQKILDKVSRVEFRY